MKARSLLLAAALALAACDPHRIVMGFPEPRLDVALPAELAYREAKGGLVVLTGRVNDRADVDFILDTGAPVTVLIDGPRTAALGLDSSKARPLGNRDNPATPVGDIQGGFRIDFGALALSGLSAVVIPQKTLPCQEGFEEIGFGGVIGADLFRGLVVEIDPRAKRVRFHDARAWQAPPSSASLPMGFRNGHPFVDARVVFANGRAVETSMNVDTGLNRPLTLVGGDRFPMPANGKPRRSCLVNGTRDEREGDAVTVELGGVKLAVAAPIYSEAPNLVDGAGSGTLGAALFAGRRLFIDYPGKRLVIASD